MKILTFGEILTDGQSAFTAITQQDDKTIITYFKGVIRVDNPFKHLSHYIEDLKTKLPEMEINRVILDFTELKYCNSNGFYTLIDIIESIYHQTEGQVIIKRLKNDDWQQETLPIIINIDDKEVKKRTFFEEE